MQLLEHEGRAQEIAVEQAAEEKGALQRQITQLLDERRASAIRREAEESRRAVEVVEQESQRRATLRGSIPRDPRHFDVTEGGSIIINDIGMQ